MHTSDDHRRAAAAFRAEIGHAVPPDLLRALHRRSPARHLSIALRQGALAGASAAGVIAWRSPLAWIPLATVLGFTVFTFTILLHEVVHHTVFATRRPRLERLLAWLYSVPCGLAASQFTRWHLDHHRELGSAEADPKRHHLSPTTNARWYKLLYCTPWLFPLYFRAAAREARRYSPPLRQLIARERAVAIAAHLAAATALAWFAGPRALVRAYVIPVFFVFPVAFTLNRLGQHYDIEPSDPRKWTTLVEGHWFWDLLFLNSDYHLEHHYFPGVPFYRLPALHRALRPYFDAHGMAARSYGTLVYGWFVKNRPPHANWEAQPVGVRAGGGEDGGVPQGRDRPGRSASGHAE